MKIGDYQLKNNLVLAPMAGITDRPFRQLCKKLGAGMTISEMVTSNPKLWHTKKSQLRMNHTGEVEPRIVQIAGADPKMMAEAAKFNVKQGAQIIDINMGCPAKKVCNVLAGSALMQNEKLVSEILTEVTKAVTTPVTLKIRTGWDNNHKNGLKIAQIAEECGIYAIAIHGRTRADAYKGNAEYDTIANIKARINIPVFANGDIDSPEKARYVLDYTQADGLYIGRAAQGRPWIFREISHYLETGEHLPEPSLTEIADILLEHLQNLHEFYGKFMGVKIARKHIGWYLENSDRNFRKIINKIEDADEQIETISNYFISKHHKSLHNNKLEEKLAA